MIISFEKQIKLKKKHYNNHAQRNKIDYKKTSKITELHHDFYTLCTRYEMQRQRNDWRLSIIIILNWKMSEMLIMSSVYGLHIRI